MPAFYAGKRVGKPLLNGHTYNALFNGKLVWPLDKDTVVSIEITDDKGKPLPKSLAVSGTLKLGAKATYADGSVSGNLKIQLELGNTAHEWMKPDVTSLEGGV